MRHDSTAGSLGFLDKVFVGTLLTVFGGIVLHAPLTVAFSSALPQYDLLIKSWKEILLLCLFNNYISISYKHLVFFYRSR